MFLMERVAYLKGLMSGLDIDLGTKEARILDAIVNVLEEMAYSVDNIEERQNEIEELTDILDQDLGQIEETVYDGKENFLLDEKVVQSEKLVHDAVSGNEISNFDEEKQDLYDYEIICPSCNNNVYLDAEVLELREIDCPNCKEHIEFDIEDDSDFSKDDFK